MVVRFGAGKKEVWILNTGACRLAISNEINPFCHTYILRGGGRWGGGPTELAELDINFLEVEKKKKK